MRRDRGCRYEGRREHVRGDRLARIDILRGDHDSDLSSCLRTVGEQHAEREHDQECQQRQPDAENEKRGSDVGRPSRSRLPDRSHRYDFSSGGNEATQRLPSQ